MVTTVVTSTTQSISAGILLDLSHINGHLNTNHVVSLLEKAGPTVVEYFEWDLPKVLSQGIAELLKDVVTEGSPQSRMWLSPTVTLIAKGSSQNLVRSRTQGY